MLHIFNGAPVVKCGDIQLTDGKTLTTIWKTYKYNRSDLNENSTESFSNGSIDIQYEYNDTQLSNLQDESVKEKNSVEDEDNKPIEYHHEKDTLYIRTTTDDLYREIYIESQCLLNSERCIPDISSTITSSQRYHDCKHRSLEELDPDILSAVIPSSENIHHKSKIMKSGKPYWRNKRIHCDDHKGSTINCIEETPPDLINKQTNCCFQLNPDSTPVDKYSCNTCGIVSSDNPNINKFTSIANSIRCLQLSNLCVVVLQTFPLKKVFIKQGINIGQTIQLASITVGDETMFYFDITLWNECAAWVDRLFVGDIILLTDISFQLFRNKTVGKTNKHSRVYNFHRPQLPYPDNWKSIICTRKLHSFVTWICETHNYLNSPVMQKCSSVVKIFTNISCEYINDIQARISNISICEGKSDHYSFLGLKLPKVTIELQDENCMSRNLFLWGEQYKYVEKMKRNINQVIVVSAVIQKFDKNNNIYSLHTTSKSDIKYIVCDNENLLNYLCTINYFQFETDSQAKVYLSSTNIQQFDDIKGILYRGCNTCFTQLNKDSSNVFNQCSKCENSIIDYCFSKFHINIKKVNDKMDDESWKVVYSNGDDSLTNGVFGEIPNSVEIIVYPDKAFKVFPNFVNSKNNYNNSIDLLEILKDEIDSLLSGKMFNFSLKKIATDKDQMSFVNEDILVMIDMLPT